MKRNMSNTDRIIRAILAILFTYLYFGGIVSGVLGFIILLLGAIFLVTAIFGFCPLYVLFKISTLKAK